MLSSPSLIPWRSRPVDFRGVGVCPRCNCPLRSCLKHVLGRHHDIELASSLQALVCGLYGHSRGISHTGRWEIGKPGLPTDSLSSRAATIAEGILDNSLGSRRTEATLSHLCFPIHPLATIFDVYCILYREWGTPVSHSALCLTALELDRY